MVCISSSVYRKQYITHLIDTNSRNRLKLIPFCYVSSQGLGTTSCCTIPLCCSYPRANTLSWFTSLLPGMSNNGSRKMMVSEFEDSRTPYIRSHWKGTGNAKICSRHKSAIRKSLESCCFYVFKSCGFFSLLLFPIEVHFKRRHCNHSSAWLQRPKSCSG